MKTFKDLKFKKQQPLTIASGIQAEMHFPNNYGISVIMTPHSYGHEKGLWEVAIMHNNSLCYDTPITNDVLGYQTDEDVTKVMKQVQALKPN